MYTLSSKKGSTDIGCIFWTGIILILTTVSLSPLLFSNVSSINGYSILLVMIGAFQVLGLSLLLSNSLSNRLTRFLLAFILLGCLLLQISMFHLLPSGLDPLVEPVGWYISLHFASAAFLFGLLIFTLIMNIRTDSRTRQNITVAPLSISESRVTIGEPFLIRFHLSYQETTPFKSVRITFTYQGYAQGSLSTGGYPGYQEHVLPIYEKKDLILEPFNPFVEELSWTIPTSLIPEDVSRKDWCLKVRVVPRRGAILESTYPLKVKWNWS